ncbi:MAG: hypothetical protein SH850_08005 [Planctomycetaceae bacterium]|nr:hypothetical protein [Planctomycetaceae bacterium]
MNAVATNPTLLCPTCRSPEARHIAADRWQCGCGRLLRRVIGSNGPAMVRWVSMPWERPAHPRRADVPPRSRVIANVASTPGL